MNQSITIESSDIDLVAEECEISKEKAESLLRKNHGNAKEAIIKYIQGA
jgi:NACalpha-BTF3-like transcription factor